MQNSKYSNYPQKSSNTKKIVIWVAISLVVVALLVAGFFLRDYIFPFNADSSNGSSDSDSSIADDNYTQITLLARAEDGSTPSKEDLEATKQILRSRLDLNGYTDAEIKSHKNGEFTIKLSEVSDTDELVAFLVKKAVLQFRDADGNVVLEGNDIKDARAEYDAISELHCVKLILNSEAREKFKNATKNAASRSADGTNYIAIFLDDELISAPFVGAEYASTGIDSEEAIISLGSDATTAEDEATDLANLIKSGSLPLELELVDP